MTGVTIVETNKPKKTHIAVRPYIDSERDNMGLQLYGIVVHDMIKQTESLACLEKDGIKRYVTGLNEYAPEVKRIADKKEREAKIKQIRETVAQLEKELMMNIIDPKDADFWNNVKLLRADNSDFWDRIEIACSNDPVFLDPTDPYDLIKIMGIEAGGFSLIATSYEVAKNMAVPPKFYLDKEESTISSKTEVKKLRNRAISELQSLFDKDSTKLMLVAKVVDANSTQYRNSTPNDVIYDNMDKFIQGEGVEKNKTRAAQMFLDVSRLDMETLKIRAIIKDSSFYKLITPKGDGFIYHTKFDTMMGRNPADLVEYLRNPLNERVLEDLMNSVERYWNE